MSLPRDEKPAETQQLSDSSDRSLKFALAIALLKTKLRQKHPGSSKDPQNPNSESNEMKWREKARKRKEEILRLKEDLKLAEDGVQYDIFPQNASCKCYFYDHMGELSANLSMDGSESGPRRFNDVLHRRFLRQVRLAERRKRRCAALAEKQHILENTTENELEQLRASADFLVELCDNVSPLNVEGGNYKNWSHQAVDFILATLKALSSVRKGEEVVESIVSGLIVRLLRRIYNTHQGDELQKSGNNLQLYVQHIMRKLGSEPYVGQRMIIAVAQRISALGETLLFMDPFDDAFPNVHHCMYIMIQLVEFLVSDYLLTWLTGEDFDFKFLEQWLACVLHARKALELLESRNALYTLYMDRIIGNLTRLLGQVSFHGKLQPDILAKLFS